MTTTVHGDVSPEGMAFIMGKTFDQWTKDDLRIEFDLRQVEQCDAWNEWVAMLADIPITITEYEQMTLDRLYRQATIFIDDWNEWELREQFVSLLVGLVEFNDLERFVATFSERTLKAMVKGIQDDKEIELSGIVDWMIARGRATPRTPYFFIHEYKQEESGTKSNRGQLLATMLAAQELNDDGKPIYGAYMLGRNWFFAVLQGRQYCMSNAYVATKEDELKDILRLMKAQKLMIHERVGL
ncbi:MAG: hypothetical protein AAF639_06645 [Chloroflexota bacterium]